MNPPCTWLLVAMLTVGPMIASLRSMSREYSRVRMNAASDA
jgi:hypothetical protein